MFKGSDKQFDDALENPELLEKYVGEIDKQRRLNAVLLILTSVAFLAYLFAFMVNGAPSFSAATVITPVSLLALCQSQISAVVAAQANIRILKAYRKTLELAAARPTPP